MSNSARTRPICSSGLWAGDDGARGLAALVFDNAEDVELVRGGRCLPDECARAHHIAESGPGRPWADRVMGSTCSGRRSAARFSLTPLRRRDPQVATTLADLLATSHFALEQAGAYIDQTGLSLAEYLRLFHPSSRLSCSRSAWRAGQPSPDGERDAGRSCSNAFGPGRRWPLESWRSRAFMAPDAIPLSWLSALVSGQATMIWNSPTPLPSCCATPSSIAVRANLRVHRLVQAV